MVVGLGLLILHNSRDTQFKSQFPGHKALSVASAAIFVNEQPLAGAIFVVVTNDPGIAGYAIARSLDKNLRRVLDALSSLLRMQLIPGVADLRDNFALTMTGYRVWEILAG